MPQRRKFAKHGKYLHCNGIQTSHMERIVTLSLSDSERCRRHGRYLEMLSDVASTTLGFVRQCPVLLLKGHIQLHRSLRKIIRILRTLLLGATKQEMALRRA